MTTPAAVPNPAHQADSVRVAAHIAADEELGWLAEATEVLNDPLAAAQALWGAL